MLLLGALAQAPASAGRKKLLFSLRGHPWHNPEHGLILSCVTELWRCSSDELRRHLPTHLARAGFPDTDVNPLFAPLQLRGDSLLSFAEELYQTLKLGAELNPNAKSNVNY
jgi:hypothetical protein